MKKFLALIVFTAVSLVSVAQAQPNGNYNDDQPRPSRGNYNEDEPSYNDGSDYNDDQQPGPKPKRFPLNKKLIIKVDGDTIEIGGSKIEERGNASEIEARLRRLEKAVRWLYINKGYEPVVEEIWECKLSVFGEVFKAKSSTENSARSAVADLCLKKRDRMFCDGNEASCTKLQ